MFSFLNNIHSNIKKMENPDFISLHRDSIMGLAILWVVFNHSGIDYGKLELLPLFLTFMKSTGYLGADIFLFVSGFGLMVGRCNKKYTLLSFYKRRFLRIMPMYWLFLTVSLVLLGNTQKLSSTLIDYTGFGFIFLNDGQWFVSAILLCYLIFPFFAKSLFKSKNKLLFFVPLVFLWAIVAIILTISAFYVDDKFSYLLLLVLRLPTFFVGGLVGYIYSKKDVSLSYLFSINFHIVFLFCCYLALVFFYLYYSKEVMKQFGLYWYPFVLGSFSLTFLLSIFFEIISKYNRSLSIILDRIGKSSLELYFIHSLIFSQISKIQFVFNYFNISLKINYLWLVAIFISVLLAIAFNSVLSHLTSSQYKPSKSINNLSR